MLMPKRVKYRRVQRGRMKGIATKGNKVAYGEYGLVATECGWITANQIEAARIAMTQFSIFIIHKKSLIKTADRFDCIPPDHQVRTRNVADFQWFTFVIEFPSGIINKFV